METEEIDKRNDVGFRDRARMGFVFCTNFKLFKKFDGQVYSLTRGQKSYEFPERSQREGDGGVQQPEYRSQKIGACDADLSF